MKKVILWFCLIIVIAGCYQIGRDAGYAEGFEAGLLAPRPIQKPASGTLLSGKKYSSSSITVTAGTSQDYVVSLKFKTGAECLAFYVAAGDTVTVGVPSNTLYAYFASGDNWYGYEKGLMFGEDTQYSRDENPLDFSNYTWEYTLYPVEDGNFTEKPISEDDFF